MEFIHTVAGLVLLAFLSLSNSLPTIMKLERALPMRSTTGVANFTLESSSGPYKLGCYVIKLKIGSPPKEFRLMIDTGSGLSWVNCNNSGIMLQSYNPNRSSSASTIACSDNRCIVDSTTHCNSQHPQCKYNLTYMDHSVTTGLLVSDVFHLDGSTTDFSTSVLFGCSEILSPPDTAFDGVLGLDPEGLSLISQLSTPVFSHCLNGGEDGGGVLVLGQILEPSIVYIPLDISQGGYNVNLQSIAVNGNIVQIDPAVFKSNKGGETIVDTGTTQTVLAENAYDPVISSLTASVSHHAQPISLGSYQCFTTSSRIQDIFPLVSFNFEGGKSMTVKPKDYLVRLTNMYDAKTWCIGFKKIKRKATTILGDIVLRDKIVIYDLAQKRLGWANYNCSQPVKVSSTDLSSRNSPTTTLTTMLTLFVYFFIFS